MTARPFEEKVDAASIFAGHFASAKYDDIPVDIVERVKMSVLDTLGVSIAASSLAPGCKELSALAEEMGGKEESSVIVFGGRVPAPMAALANGGLAHGLDFDDIDYEGLCHPSGAVIPAAFAAAERAAPTTGKEFITAVALGQDMVMRMTSALHCDREKLFDWMWQSAIAVFAAAATSGRLLGLSPDRIHTAIGIALAYSTGAGEIRRGELRGLYDSWAAMGGVLSALMAAKGVNGPRSPLEGERGFYKSYFNSEYRRDTLLGDLGKRFHNHRIGYKAWPSCAGTHSPIDSAIKLVEEHRLGPDDIQEITVFVGTHTLVNCEPVDEMRNPKTVLEAKFSVPFTVALACTKRRVTLADFTPEAIRDPSVLRLAQRVVPRLDMQLKASWGIEPSIVQIETKTGEKYSKRIDFVFGHYRNPMAMEDVVRKFEDCASYSARSMSQDSLRRVVDMITRLEEVGDVGDVIRRVAPAGGRE